MRYIWAVSCIVQLIVFFLVITKQYSRKLPLFTAYIALNLCQAGFLILVYSRFSFHSNTSYELFWISEALTLVAQTLAATELLHYVLRHYRGLWALAGRLLALAALVIVSCAALSAGRDTDWGLVTADRGYHLTFSVAIVSCLLLIRFYSIPVNPAYKTLLGGFCLFSCVFVVADTLGRTLSVQRFVAYNDVWNYGKLIVFAAVQIVWAAALWQPAPAMDEEVELLPASTYERLSPEINSRLRLMNDALCKFWRLETPRP